MGKGKGNDQGKGEGNGKDKGKDKGKGRGAGQAAHRLLRSGSSTYQFHFSNSPQPARLLHEFITCWHDYKRTNGNQKALQDSREKVKRRTKGKSGTRNATPPTVRRTVPETDLPVNKDLRQVDA